MKKLTAIETSRDVETAQGEEGVVAIEVDLSAQVKERDIEAVYW